MKNVLEWIKEAENTHFAAHIFVVFVMAAAVEFIFPAWTTFTYPALLFLAAASFMWNYPVSAIKSHGLFSEYLIELRLLWLLIIGIAFEYAAFGLLESRSSLNIIMAMAAFFAGLVVVFYSRGRLQERIVEERGFK
jgi:hypothetical protein